MISIDVNAPGGWTAAVRKYAAREARLQRAVPVADGVVRLISSTLRGLLALVCSGTHNFREQVAYVWLYQRGMYGGGGALSEEEKKIINLQELLGGVNWPGAASGPRFLQSAYVEPVSDGPGVLSCILATQAQMQPYAVDLPQRPIMYYFRHGWASYRGARPDAPVPLASPIHMVPRMGSEGHEFARYIQQEATWPGALRLIASELQRAWLRVT